jgi:hypothetical protein
MKTRRFLTVPSLGHAAVLAVIVGVTILGFVSGACGQGAGMTFQQVPAASIDQAQKAFAQKVADTTLKAWTKGRFAPVGADFNDAMKTGLPVEKQRQAWDTIRQAFGDYQSVTFHEALTSPALAKHVVYRFRGVFTKGQPEVRVVTDPAGKIGGFFVLIWQDKLQ